MVKLVNVVFLGLLVAVAAWPQGPAQVISSLASSGSADPILSPWGVDVVTWTQVGTAPVVFGRSGGGILGNYMYEFGSEGVNTAQAFNLTTETWQASTPATHGYDNWASATTASAIYLIGGYNGSSGLNYTQRFTPTGGGPTGTWTQLAPYPLAVFGPTAAWDGGDFIYVASGNTGGGYSLTAYKYSISDNSWIQLANPPVSQSFSGSAYVGGKFFVFGGTDAAGLGTRHYAYNPATNTWSQMAPVWVPVWFATSSTTFNQDYMFSVGGGGGYSSWPATNAVQIYNPATNAWFPETALPVARGTNQARWAGDGKIISGGGYAGGYSGATYRGLGFPDGGPPVHDIAVDLAPINYPIQLPAAGGSFDFYAFVTNNETSPVQVTLWIEQILPDSTTQGPLLGPATVTLEPGTRGWYRVQNVPGTAMPGTYTYIGKAGTYPINVWDSDQFDYTKLATGLDVPWVGNWDNWGDAIGEEATQVMRVLPDEFALKAAYPNPFNPTTAINFSLSNDDFVNLTVFDLSGRRVATLVDGWREVGTHAVSFDASGLPAGVYIYRLAAGSFSASGKMVLLK